MKPAIRDLKEAVVRTRIEYRQKLETGGAAASVDAVAEARASARARLQAACKTATEHGASGEDVIAAVMARRSYDAFADEPEARAACQAGVDSARGPLTIGAGIAVERLFGWDTGL